MKNLLKIASKHIHKALKILGELPISAIIIILIILVKITHATNTLIHKTPSLKTPNISPIIKITKLIAKVTTISLTTLIITGIVITTYIYQQTPPAIIDSNSIPLTTRIFDRNGNLLYEMYRDQNRTLIQLSQLPQYVIQAHIAIEDSEFYNHPGLSVPGITRAFINNAQIYTCETISKHPQLLSQIGIPQPHCPDAVIQGASTITQQLIKNTLLTPERTWQRKITEAILAIKLERRYTKPQILEMYLNQIPYGGTAYGIEAASQYYFNKPATDLTISEAALLAGLPQAPTTYSPFGSQPQQAKLRQEQVLARMLQLNYISQEQYLQAINQPLTYATPEHNIQAPHFVMYTKELLENKLGSENLYHGGLNVYTSLDLELQNFAQQTLNEELDRLKNFNVTNGAVLITRPKTGEILAMVGSKDYFDTEHQGNVNATTALRQPGSSIKPLTYATALSLSIPNSFTPLIPHTYTAASIINDAPITFKIPGSDDYKPKNYDGKFHGRVTVRTALASSYNIPAVKTLNDVGISQLLTMAQKLGITTWNNPQRYGLALTLGSAEVKMVDMASLYGTFANLGYTKTVNPILKIENHQLNDQSLPSPFPVSESQLDPRVAFIINHILSDPNARIPAFGRLSKLNIPGHTVAVKTGTTNTIRDNWTIGYTPEYLVAVWVGNFDNTPMSRIASGITGATPVWNKIMTHILEDTPTNLSPQLTENNFPWTPPSGLIKVPICPYTGTLPCGNCPTKEEWFVYGTQPTQSCRHFQSSTPTP